jgi:hypothetical protein
MLRGILFTCAMQLIFNTAALAAPRVDKPTAGKRTTAAQPSKMTKSKPAGTATTSINLPSRKKNTNLVGVKKYKTNQNQVSFDETIIQGETVNPIVSGISGQKSDQEFDLIPLRKKWHSEMIDSTIEY